MSLLGWVKTSCETRELHSDGDLRTRYYRNDFKASLEALKKIAGNHKWEIRNVDENHGEVYVMAKGFDIIVSIVTINPIETAIDMKVNVFSTFGFNKPKKTVVSLYKEFDKILSFKGVSLHP